MKKFQSFFSTVKSAFGSLTNRVRGRTKTKDKSNKKGRNDDSDEDEQDNDEDDEDDDDDDEEMVAEVTEHERWAEGNGWSARNLSKGKGDPAHFLSSIGGSNMFPNPPLTAVGWEYSGKWRIDMECDGVSGGDGWMYGNTFKDLDEGDTVDPASKKAKKRPPMVRRKRWVRTVVAKAVAKGDEEEKHGPVAVDKIRINVKDNSNNAKKAVPKRGDTSNETKQKTRKSGFAEVENEVDDLGEEDGVEGEEAHVAAARFEVDSEAGDDDNSDGDTAEDLASSPSPVTKENGAAGKMDEKAQKARVRSIQSNAQKQATGGGGGSFFGFGLGSGTKDVDGLLMQDEGLVSLGRQIRAIEGEIKRDGDEKAKAWAATTKPRLEKEVGEWERKCAALRNRIDCEARKGLEHIASLEEELRPVADRLEAAKKALYFPTSNIVLGQGGVRTLASCYVCIMCLAVCVYVCVYSLYMYLISRSQVALSCLSWLLVAPHVIVLISLSLPLSRCP